MIQWLQAGTPRFVAEAFDVYVRFALDYRCRGISRRSWLMQVTEWLVQQHPADTLDPVGGPSAESLSGRLSEAVEQGQQVNQTLVGRVGMVFGLVEKQSAIEY